jgi:two-component system, response regulator PdtaR
MNGTHPDGSPLRALIVEAEILIPRDLTVASLGFEVCRLAASDQKARWVAVREHPDLALVDISLTGGREGIETARWLREACDASIVFVTASTEEGTLEAVHDGVPGAPVLAKPVDAARLSAAVAAVSPRHH